MSAFLLKIMSFDGETRSSLPWHALTHNPYPHNRYGWSYAKHHHDDFQFLLEFFGGQTAHLLTSKSSICVSTPELQTLVIYALRVLMGCWCQLVVSNILFTNIWDGWLMFFFSRRGWNHQSGWYNHWNPMCDQLHPRSSFHMMTSDLFFQPLGGNSFQVEATIYHLNHLNGLLGIKV